MMYNPPSWNDHSLSGTRQWFSNSSENIAILCTLLSKAIRFLPVNFLFDNKTLIALLESLFSGLSVNFNWNDCNWEFKISTYLKSGYLSFALESTLKKELVIENVRAICWIVPKKIYSFWIKLFYFILEVALIDHYTYLSITVVITISVSRKKIYNQ